MDPSLEAALAEAGWLRSLAVQLVGGAAADDLVQETYLAALAQRDAPRPRDWRAWLATVLRRKAHNAHRGAARRRDHEARAADPATGRAGPAAAAGGAFGAYADTSPVHGACADEPSERLMRLEIQKALLEAIGTLAPERAEVVLRRYLDGEQPAAIATALGVPPGTVRSRLTRALEDLRFKLDGRFGREAWLGAIGPWAFPFLHTPLVPSGVDGASNAGAPSGSALVSSGASHAPQGAAPAVGSSMWTAAGIASWLGGVIMLKWLVAVAAVLMLGLGWLKLGAEPPEPGRAIGTGEGARGERAVASRRENGGSARTLVTAPAEGAVDQEIDATPTVPEFRQRDFKVVDAATGAPLAGVEVRRLKRAQLETRWGLVEGVGGELVARSDAAGKFQVEVVQRVPTDFILCDTGRAERAFTVIAEAEVTEPVLLELSALRWLNVQVLDEHEQPVSGVVVKSITHDRDVTVDANDASVFRIRGSRAWDELWRRASPEPTDVEGITRVGAFDSEELEVWRGGQLIAAAGHPELRETDGEAWAILRLPQPYTLSGTLLDADGLPVAGQGLELMFGVGGQAPRAQLRTRTDLNGTWRFEPVPTSDDGEPMERLRLVGGRDRDSVLPADQVVQIPNGVGPLANLDWSAAVDGELSLDLRAIRTGSIRGFVVDEAGAPVAAERRFSVEVRTLDDRYVASAFALRGEFEVKGLAPGQYELELRQNGRNERTRVLATTGDERVKLVAETGYSLRLRLASLPELGDDGHIGSSRSIYCYAPDGSVASLSGTMGSSGSYSRSVDVRGEELVANAYRVLVRTREGLVGFGDVVIPQSDEPAEILMGLAGILEVRVGFAKELKDEPQVYLEWEGKRVRFVESMYGEEHVPPGILTVSCERPDGTLAVETVLITAGETTRVRLE